VSGPGYWYSLRRGSQAASIVLVNRGFVPEGKRDPKTRPQGRPSGVVEVAGALRWPEQRGSFTPADEPEKGLWFAPRSRRNGQSEALGYQRTVYVDQEGPPAPGGLPKVGPAQACTAQSSPGVTAVTWYGLALAILIAALFFVRANASRGLS